MADDLTLDALKRTLHHELRLLFSRNGSAWKRPILDVCDDLRLARMPAVLFGGTLRSLLVSRVFFGRFGRPRDIDVVVAQTPVSELERRFKGSIARRTRFGGLQLHRDGWHFDVWPVDDTWAFAQDCKLVPSFESLPSTTTFNLEAIAAEVWPEVGPTRQLFSGDDQFFRGILDRTLELNRSDSPFPALTIVRAFAIASELGFRLGPELAGYIASRAPLLTAADLEHAQVSHYGHVRIGPHTLAQLIELVGSGTPGTSVALPPLGQLRLWRDCDNLRLLARHIDREPTFIGSEQAQPKRPHSASSQRLF